MIACISPGSSSAEHTLNTLRYASRLKDTVLEANDLIGALGQAQHNQPPPSTRFPPPVSISRLHIMN